MQVPAPVADSPKKSFFSTSYFRPGLQIAKHALGKYIIAFACVLHLAWASLLLIDSRAGNATPLSVLFALLMNDRILVVTVLVAVAVLAGAFLDLRLRKLVNISVLSLLLLPQQLILLCSAGGGIYATCIQQYADGVPRSWAHILADQLPIILMAVLYTVALLEVRNPPEIELPIRALKAPVKPGQAMQVVIENP